MGLSVRVRITPALLLSDIRTEVVEKLDGNVFDPWQLRYGIPHITRHEERKIGRAPVRGQPELDYHPAIPFYHNSSNKP
jgi:hypothetical protein